MKCCCSANSYITIYQGYATNFFGEHLAVVSFKGEMDISNLKASFIIGSIKKEYQDLSQGFIIDLTKTETASLPIGPINGTLIFEDENGVEKPIITSIPIMVENWVQGTTTSLDSFKMEINVENGGQNVLDIFVEAGVSVKVGTTTTLPPGSNATVSNSGTQSNLVLDFEIPRGDKGDEGPQGPEGPEGPAGKDGEDGQDGKDGKDAKINGVNTLTLNTTYGISLSQSGNTATISGKEITDVVDGISSLIPAQASEQNQLADKNFVNSSVQTATANFRGNWANWEDVPTNVNDYPEDYAQSKTPTVNDYLVVQDASDYTGETIEGTWRFKYSGTWSVNGKNGWHPEYQVNETPLTAAQLAALNSGITAEGVSQITTNENAIGNLSTLSTSSKTDLVSALNEVNSTAGSKVSDVTVAGTSVVNNGVAEIPNASGSVEGVVKLSANLTSISDTIAATASMGNNLAKNIITGVNTYSASSTYAVGDKVRYGQYYYECNTAITTAHAWNASEWTQITIQGQLDEKVDDVTVNGTSIVADGVATIPLAVQNGDYGLVKLGPHTQGLQIDTSGYLKTFAATETNIDEKTNAFRPIAPNKLDYATKRGLAYNSLTLTDTEKGNACTWLNAVNYTTNTGVNVAGLTKNVDTYSGNRAYFPNGLIAGISAQDLPIITRSVCGCSSPNATTGACTKDNLYINYDGDNTYRSSRQLILQAGTVGTGYGNNVYQYAAVRGDALKGYCDSTYEALTATATITSGTSFECTDNTIFDGGSSAIAAVTCTLPSTIPADYWVQINFASGSTATTFTYDSSIKWVDGCDDVQFISNVRKFVPVANKRYTVMFISDGTNVIATAKGV